MHGRRRDWFRILRDLTAAGISMADVGRKCNREARTVARWSEGSDPKDADAQVVLALYAKHCPEKYLAHAREFAIRQPDRSRVTVLLDCLVELELHR